MYFYDIDQDCFLAEGIHAIPESAVAVSESEYQILFSGKSAGKAIYQNSKGKLQLTASARPSSLHQWDGKGWIINERDLQAVISAEKSAKLAEINRKAQEFVNQLAHLDETPEFERETWSIQREEAKAWNTDKRAETPTLALIAQMRGVPLDVLRQKAYEKAVTYQTVAAVVAGQRQAYEDRLNRAETLEQIRAIGTTYQLPQGANNEQAH